MPTIMMKCKSRFAQILVAGFVTAGFNGSALAYDWSISAKVTMIEATYMPIGLDFEADHAGGSCASGSLLNWTPQGPDATSKSQNAQAVFALLMTAKSSGQSVTLFGNNSSCQVSFIYLQ